MTRVFVIGVIVAAILLPITACKKKEEAKQPAAEQSAAPSEPAPAPDKPET